MSIERRDSTNLSGLGVPGTEVHLDGQKDWTEHRLVQALHAECLRLIRKAQGVAIDLRDVRVMDSKLIACLIAIQREAAKRGLHMSVRLSEATINWMDACQVRRFLELRRAH